MTSYDIHIAYATIRMENNTIPDEVLDFMKDAAVEKLEGYKAALSKGNGDVSWDAAIKRYDEITPTFLQNIGSFTKFLLRFYTLKAKTTA